MSKQTNDFQQLIAMVVELLEGGEVVESREFPDPDTGVPREVDVYALVEGKANGEDIRIAVECVDRSKPMGAPWVEAMYGKHSRLQVADIVLLVSSKGFYRPGELKARKFGYKTISPAISPVRLARAVGVENHRMGAKAATFSYRDCTVTVGVPGVFVDEGNFLRADGSELIQAGEYYMRAGMEQKGGMDAFVSEESTNDGWDVSVADPVWNGEALHVKIRCDDGQVIVTPAQVVSFKAKYSSTNWGHFEQTRQGDFDGVKFGTGDSTIGGEAARMVVVEDGVGNQKSMVKFQYTPGTDHIGS